MIPTFKEWVENLYYPGFDLSGLTDEEYWELEDQYREEIENGNDNDA